MDYPLVNLTARLYLSLFAQMLPEQSSVRVLDIFLLLGRQKGKVIFDVTLGYFRCIYDRVVSCHLQEQLLMTMSEINEGYKDCDELISQIR